MDHTQSIQYDDVNAADGQLQTVAEQLPDEPEVLPAILDNEPNIVEDDAVSVTESDSSDVAFDKAEEKIDRLFDLYGASPAAIKPYLVLPSPYIPLVSEGFSHTLRKTAGNSDGSLRIVDDKGEPMVFTVIGELAKGQHWELNKVSPYLDMVYKLNQKDTISLDGLRRAKARLVLRTLNVSELVSPEGQDIINQCNDRFERLMAFLATVHDRYQETRAEQDEAAYGKEVAGSSWLYHGSDFFGMNISTPVIFTNVPSDKGKDPSVPIVQGDKLVSVEQVNAQIRLLKLQALKRTEDNRHDLSLIANWPDDLNLIRAVGEETYLGDVRIFEPDVFNTQGIRIHPSMYEQYLRPGTRVAVKVAHKLWDFSYNRQGKPVPNPTRHCVAVALEVHVIGSTEEDIRDSLHYHEARGRMDRVKEHEAVQQAEQHREQLRRKEAERLKIAADLAKAREIEKQERLAQRKSLWKTAAGSSSTGSSPSTSRAPQTMSPVSSSSKRLLEEDPPSSPSPTKRRIGSATGKSKPSSRAGRNTRSKALIGEQKEQDDASLGADKGKGKANEDMEVDE